MSLAASETQVLSGHDAPLSHPASPAIRRRCFRFCRINASLKRERVPPAAFFQNLFSRNASLARPPSRRRSRIPGGRSGKRQVISPTRNLSYPTALVRPGIRVVALGDVIPTELIPKFALPFSSASCSRRGRLFAHRHPGYSQPDGRGALLPFRVPGHLPTPHGSVTSAKQRRQLLRSGIFR